MVWVKIDDKLRANKKWRRASSDAKVLWLEGLCFANDNLTDGRLTSEALALMAVTTGLDTGRIACELADLQLWEPYMAIEGEPDDGDGGYWIHDYAQYQPTRDKLARQRELKRQRQARWRAGQRDPGPGRPGLPVDASRDARVVASVDASTNGNGNGTRPALVPRLHLPLKPHARATCDPLDLEELRQARRVM